MTKPSDLLLGLGLTPEEAKKVALRNQEIIALFYREPLGPALECVVLASLLGSLVGLVMKKGDVMADTIFELSIVTHAFAQSTANTSNKLSEEQKANVVRRMQQMMRDIERAQTPATVADIIRKAGGTSAPGAE